MANDASGIVWACFLLPAPAAASSGGGGTVVAATISGEVMVVVAKLTFVVITIGSDGVVMDGGDGATISKN